MINKGDGDIRVQAKDIQRVQEIQRQLRRYYPYISERQIQIQAWKIFAAERRNK